MGNSRGALPWPRHLLHWHSKLRLHLACIAAVLCGLWLHNDQLASVMSADVPPDQVVVRLSSGSLQVRNADRLTKYSCAEHRCWLSVGRLPWCSDSGAHVLVVSLH